MRLSSEPNTYKSIFDHINIGMYRTTIDGKFLMANPAMIAMLGCNSFEDLDTINLNQTYVLSYDRKDFIYKILKFGAIKGLISSMHIKDNSIIYIRENAVAVKDEQSKLLYFEGTIEDISNQIDAEQALAESENLFQDLFELSPQGLAIIDLKGNFIRVNSTLCKILDYSPVELLHSNIESITAKNFSLLAQKTLAQPNIHTEKHIEEVYVRRDGKKLWLKLSISPIKHAGSTKFGLGIVEDITDQKIAEDENMQLITALKISNRFSDEKANQITELNKELYDTSQKLQKLNSTKDKFFSIIAHDLKSPFQGFIGLSKILSEELDLLKTDEIQEIADNLMQSSRQLYKLLENLLQWSRIQRGHLKIEKDILNAHELVNMSYELLEENAQNKGIKLINEIDKSFNLFADMNAINTVIRNLISNAIKFCHSGDSIRVYAEEGETITIFVEDTGIGISEKDLENVLRIDVSHSTFGTDNEPGTGLGLVLCNELLALHHSNLEVKSTFGEGTTFYFSIEKYEYELEM